MALNRGKEFENMYYKATVALQNEGYPVDVSRLYDVVNKKTIEQPADYIAFREPNEIYVECKSTNDTSFDYYDQPQYTRLIKKSLIKGVRAGMLVWFVKLKRVFWVDARFLQGFYASYKLKSFTVGRLVQMIESKVDGVFEVEQETKRVNPEMRLRSLYNYISGEIDD